MTPDRLQDRLRAAVEVSDRRRLDIPEQDALREAADRLDELEAGPASTLPDTERITLLAGTLRWVAENRPLARMERVQLEDAALILDAQTQTRGSAAYQPPMARCDNPDGRCTMREWCTSYDSCWATNGPVAERDRPARAIDPGLPLIPMPNGFPSPGSGPAEERRAYTDAMTEWVRLVLRATNPEQTTGGGRFSPALSCERRAGIGCTDPQRCMSTGRCLFEGQTTETKR